ncbi:MAG: cytochrome c oxidase assembly protein [Brevirhabdus sp.]
MKANSSQRTVFSLIGVVLFMGAMAWVAVPFYSWFCATTGFGGATIAAEDEADVILDQTIKVRFDANKEPGMPWEFKPVVREVELRIGETALAFYEAYNPTDKPVAGMATYNVTPYAAGPHFIKIECFCFTEQVLQPGERVQMPVTFYVDPEIVDDPDANFVKQITLSYTFFQTELPTEQATLAVPAETKVN